MKISDRVKQKADIPNTEIDNEISFLNIDSGEYLMSNHIGLEMWKLMIHPIEISKIIEGFIELYDIDYETCKADVLEFMDELYSQNLIEVV